MSRDEQLDQLGRTIARLGLLRDAMHSVFAGVSDGVEPAAYKALYVLCRRPQRSRELAETLRTDPSTVSRHVSQLTAEGLVRREADPDDGRAIRLVPTERGYAKFTELMTRRRQVLNQLVGDWSDTELREFISQLNRFLDHAESLTSPQSKGSQ